MHRLRILIVSDRLDVASSLGQRLAALDYEVVGTASPGKDVVRLAAASAPDLLLMDACCVEGASEAEDVIRAIQNERSSAVVLLGTQELESQLRAHGSLTPDGFLISPFSDRELETSLELAVCRHDRARAAEELEGFFAVSIDLFCFLDFNGYFRRLNPAWERTLGFTREELMSRPFITFVHPDDRARTLEQNADVRRGGQARGFENRYLCKDGSYRWLMWNATPHSLEGVIYSAARDVTARKDAEAERALLVSKLEASLAEVRTLREILPTCMYCKRIRDDEEHWQTVESYISRHTATRFSHGICPACMESEVEPQFTEGS